MSYSPEFIFSKPDVVVIPENKCKIKDSEK
jgi:hypothetical protein